MGSNPTAPTNKFNAISVADKSSPAAKYVLQRTGNATSPSKVRGGHSIWFDVLGRSKVGHSTSPTNETHASSGLAPMDRDLEHLYPEFREKIVQILAMMKAYAKVHMQGYSWRIVEGFRTAEYQRKLWLKRPRVTYKDGYVHESGHQSSLAADIVPFHGYDFDWNGKKEWWDYLAHCARSVGLKSGNDWKSFKDSAHIEWDTADHATYAKAREWQKSVGLRK